MNFTQSTYSFFRTSDVDHYNNDVNGDCDAHPEQDGGPGQAGASTFACYG